MPLTLDDLRPNPGAKQSRTRVGRGHGSGKGKTAGRGTKGQKARSHAGVGRGFEGGQLPIQRRMPYKRGFTNIYKPEWEIVNLSRLEELAADGPVTPELLQWADLIVVMERVHRSKLTAKFRTQMAGKCIVCLEIPDRFDYMEPSLVRLLKARVPKHLPSSTTS